jgi:hypothetical protein
MTPAETLLPSGQMLLSGYIRLAGRLSAGAQRDLVVLRNRNPNHVRFETNTDRQFGRH